MNRIVVPVYGSDSTPDFTLQPAPDPEPESELEPEPAIYRTSVKSRANTSSRTSQPLPSSSVCRKPNESRSYPARLGWSSIVNDCNVSAALPVATYSPVISPTVGLTFGMSRPIEMPATTATTSRNRNTFR